MTTNYIQHQEYWQAWFTKISTQMSRTPGALKNQLPFDKTKWCSEIAKKKNFLCMSWKSKRVLIHF